VVSSARPGNDHHRRERDSEERYLLRLLNTGEKDRGSLRNQIQNYDKQLVEMKNYKKKLRRNVAELKDELAFVTKEKDNIVSDLRREVQELRKLKDIFSSIRDDDHKELIMDLNEPKRKTKKYRRYSISSAPHDIIDDRTRTMRTHLYQQQLEIDDVMAKTDIDISNVRDGGKRTPLHQSRRRSIGRAQSNAGVVVSPDKVKAAAHSFLDFFCNLKPKVLKSLWKTHVVTRDSHGMRILLLINLPTFLHTLIQYIFRQDNADHPLPSRRRTRPLVTFLELRLNPYLGNKKYINLQHFLKFPEWLIGRNKSDGSPSTSRKAAWYMSSAEVEHRRALKVGSTCKIWSAGGNAWFGGKVIEIQHDSLGEWLVVQYYHNNLVIRKEVQRFSKLLDISTKYV